MLKEQNRNISGKAAVDFSSITQVEDDPVLFERMLQDTAVADPLYRPTNYWEVYSRIFVPEIRKKGLKDFRRRLHGPIRSFGATDIFPRPFVKVNLPRGGGLVGRLLTKAFEVLPLVDLEIEGIAPAQIAMYFHDKLKRDFHKKGLDLSVCQSNRIGNPSGFVEIDGEIWTINQLSYCRMFIDAIEHFEMPENGIICELGPGLGRNVEILASLYPNATFIMFDIPPQVYLVNQYMKKRFPCRFVPYEEAMEIDVTDPSAVIDKIKGKIVLLPAKKMPEWSSMPVDLFWNSASFQEMESNVVTNYLHLASNMDASTIFINAAPGGNYWGEWSPGKGGIKEKMSETIFEDSLSDKYDLRAEFFTDMFNEKPGSSVSYIFKKR
jgi:putative sugar O-methyltransferase